MAATAKGRVLFGTSSEIATVKEIWTAPASPRNTSAPIKVLTFWAVAPMMEPIREKALPPMKNQRRPKISDNRPTIRNPTLRPSVYDIETQLIFADGPISSSM